MPGPHAKKEIAPIATLHHQGHGRIMGGQTRRTGKARVRYTDPMRPQLVAPYHPVTCQNR
jgi:hypothetical protein